MSKDKEIGFFVTCLVDLLRPSVGFASIKLLEKAGYKVIVPNNQVCCGQVSYNSGDNKGTIKAAINNIDAFIDCKIIIVPSGSCSAIIKKHYPKLLQNNKKYYKKAIDLANRTYELTSFLQDKLLDIPVKYNDKTITYHDSCSGLRELGIKAAPRKLLNKISGLDLIELPTSSECCGFGGAFCLKYSEISDKMVDKKTDNIVETKADIVAGGDLGCLLNMAGNAMYKSQNKQDNKQEYYHISEILAGIDDIDPINKNNKT